MMLLAALLCYVGFTCLCLSMARHYSELLKGSLTGRRRRVLKLIGWSALVLSSWAAVDADGWMMGVVHWFAVLMSSAVLLVALLPFRPRWVLALAGCGALLSPFAAMSQLLA
ncbi:iron uptake protein [Pseudomonas syringae pv. coriandricola]|uniref:Iron uptake protein n=2 Tax=Pseudomonas syringae group genomosp. 3 TaxID=251701 RepID=A0A3M5RH29_9PSED|nr:iron uptake protein [Pseudomonas syringae pv. coriandricola]